jgi:uncharacterized protein YaaR (DUF327 family)
MNKMGISEFVKDVKVGQNVSLSTTELDYFGNNVSYDGEVLKIDNNSVKIKEYNDYIKDYLEHIVELSTVYVWYTY